MSLAAKPIEVQVLDAEGTPISGAVVEVKLTKHIATENFFNIAAMAQKNKRFVPHILAVQKGTPVTFPNQDSIKHHVYSFSPAKTFELKLYKESLPSPLTLDKAGIVTMGCNIHDWMAGYIYVSESPYFGQTNTDGIFKGNMPADIEFVKIWHPRFNENDLDKAKAIKPIDGKVTLSLSKPLYPNLDVEAEEFAEYE